MSILIFDSGIGGLSIYSEVRRLMPYNHYIYLFDNQGFPYGEQSSMTIKRRLIAVIDKITSVHHVDLAVIACNTATVAGLSALRWRYHFPIVGTVPAIKLAVKMSTGQRIGLLATKTTLASPYTTKLIQQFAMGRSINRLAVTELVYLAEEKLRGQPVDMQKLMTLMHPWLSLSEPLDTIVLGCTHYFFIKEELQSIFPNSRLICSTRSIAKQVVALSKKLSLSVETESHCENVAVGTLFDTNTIRLIPVFKKYALPIYETVSLKI